MKLNDFLEMTGQKPSHFADKLSVSPSTVIRWADGARRPNIDMLIKLRDATDGRVTMEDFPKPPKKAAAQKSRAA